MDINNLNDLQALFGPRPLNTINPVNGASFKWTTTHTVLAVSVGVLALVGTYAIIQTVKNSRESKIFSRPELGS